jgi:hypothetical protein
MKDSYRVIKSPIQLAEGENHGVRSFLGRSEKGVYIAAIASKAWPNFECGLSANLVVIWSGCQRIKATFKINTCSWRL